MRVSAIVIALAAASLPITAEAGLKGDIQARGFLTCGVTQGVAGFSLPDKEGVFRGLDVDTCRAVAAAVLGQADKVKYTPLSAQQRFIAVQSGEVDILASRATQTLSRDAAMGISFGPTTYYDGQGVMVHKRLGVTSVADLKGATICVQPGTTTELNLADWFRSRNLSYTPVVIENRDQIEASYLSGRCDAFSNDAASLAASRSTRAVDPAEHVILPEIMSKEPLAPAVRKGDDEFFTIVKWSVYALIEAEERGITSKNAEEMAQNPDPNIRRLLGTTPGNGKSVGLDEAWALRVIRQVGNYGEIYDRNVGMASALKLERGLNRLWTEGGLMYAPPVR